MATTTTKLLLTKPAGTDPMSRTAINSDLEIISDLLPAKVVTTAQQNALSPFEGQAIFNTDTNRYQFWNGTKWIIVTNKPFIHAYRNTTMNVGNVAALVVPLQAVTKDTDTFWASSPNPSRITIPAGKDGTYLVIASLAWTTTFQDLENWHLLIFRNGTQVATRLIVANNDHPMKAQVAYIDEAAVAGTYYEIWTDHNAPSTYTVASGETNTFLQATYLGV